MPSDFGDSRRTPKTQTANGGGAAPLPPPEQEHLPCPRCDSTNTKFCYYNNYNFSQPRHFCKSCRRYWTHGGTLRDIPVGGGSRKNAKRSRTCSSYTTAGIISSAGGMMSSSHHELFPTAPALVSLGAGFGSTRSFTSLLNNTHGPGFLALGGGFGLGLGHGFEDVGFGVGKGVWPFSETGFVSAAAANGANGHGGGNGHGHGHGHGVMGGDTLTWQPESGGNGFVDGDCFSWPDLAISAPGNGLK